MKSTARVEAVQGSLGKWARSDRQVIGARARRLACLAVLLGVCGARGEAWAQVHSHSRGGLQETKAAAEVEKETTQQDNSPALNRVDDSTPLLKEVPRVTEDRPISFWMKHKLQDTQKLLESITLADYEKTQTYAEQLLILSKIEGFVRRKNPDYRQQLANFQATLKLVKFQAEQGNSTEVLAGFGKLTQSCVRCHQVLRDNINPKVITPERSEPR